MIAATSVSGLDIQAVTWGFDGKVVPGRFNLLSVLAANNSLVPFDGTMRLSKSRGVGNRIGAAARASCYLSPQTTRWLQFYVYVDNQYDQWRLEWGRGPGDHEDLDPPKWGASTQVFLSDGSATLSAASVFRAFPEELFPPTVAATSGLDSMLLDHAPHWEAARRQAFLNWLRTGGKLHLLLGADGRFPVFSDELAVLNLSAERAHVGAGTVTRHHATASEVRKEDVRDIVSIHDFKPEESIALGLSTRTFLNSLSVLSQRHYNWAAIYLLGIAFVVLIGPGNLRAAQKIADYRLRILLLLATVAGFGFLFFLVGRRGSGEMNVVHSLSYARAIDGDTYKVMQWANVFAARGSQYTITHPAPHNLYATGDDYEAVKGWIQNGKDGRFVVDIPMFSGRAFLHEAEMKGDRISVKVQAWDGADKLTKLILSLGPEVANRVLEGWVVTGDQIYPAKISQSQLEFDDAYKEPLVTFTATASAAQTQIAYGSAPQTAAGDEADRFRKLANSLIVWSLDPIAGEKGFQSGGAPQATEGRVQLFLFARSPKGFGVAGGEFHEVGYVLYHLDLFRPETEGKL
jgi:hypothetical protein